MGLATPVSDQRALHIKPLGAFCAVVSSQTRQVLGSLGVLELLQVLGREDVGFDLIDISVRTTPSAVGSE